jgi:hypothetical protein
MERANKATIARVVARCEKKRRRDISKEASLISGLSLPLCYAAQNTPSVLAARFREAWNPDMYPIETPFGATRRKERDVICTLPQVPISFMVEEESAAPIGKQ